jgi:antitoxin CptB
MLACGPCGRNAACAKQAADIAAEALYITRSRPRPGFWRWSEAVSGSQISSDGMDTRRRRLKFRSWHRGIREMDLILGPFADAQLAALSDVELDEYETWLDIPDQQFFAWVNGSETTPYDIDTTMFRRLCDFYTENK